MLKLLKKLIPPKDWQSAVTVTMGVFVGLNLYVIKISHATSYLSDSPATCINCHVMQPQYSGWFHSSHREGATCNDCHVPHNNIFNKYYFKAKDGLRHAFMFTFRLEPQVIQIKHEGRDVVQENCKRCHGYVNSEVGTLRISGKSHDQGSGKLCWDCHREIPHGTVSSLSVSPNNLVPKLQSPVPEWLNKLIKKK